MNDPKIANQIANLKKQLADAEKVGNNARVTTLKLQLDNLIANAIKAKKLSGAGIELESKKYNTGNTNSTFTITY